MTKRDLAFEFIPNLILEYNRDEITQKDLLDTFYWQLLGMFENEDFEWEEVHVELLTLSESESVGVITFPKPEECPQAKYGLIYFDSNAKVRDYYSLELSFNLDNFATEEEKFMVCSVSINGKDYFHSNYGILEKEATVNNFIEFTGKLKLFDF